MDASETPLRLATSAIVSRSVSRKIRTICSSEYRLFFIQCPHLRGIISKLDWFGNPGAGHGYDRFDNPALVDLMNDLYANEWGQYQNHFCPVMKLIEKKKINSRYYKRYDKPMTPYYRLMGTTQISKETKDKLREQHKSLNPFELKRVIDKKLKRIFEFVTVTSQVRNRL